MEKSGKATSGSCIDREANCSTSRAGIGNCHRAGIDAQAYLTDLFTRLPLPIETSKTLGALTLQGWTVAQKSDEETPET